MGIGLGVVLIAVGLILAIAVHTHVSGIDIHTIGWILVIVGGILTLLSLIFWSTWAGPGYWGRRRGYPDEAPPPGAPY
jgi:hypothetical protein